MFPPLIPVAKVTKLEGLNDLITQEGKSIPTDKEVRVSHGNWKIKEQAGTGTSRSRESHRLAAVKELRKLWGTALQDRNCSHLENETLKAVLGAKPSVIRVEHLKTLQQIVALMDDLNQRYPKIQGAGTAELVAHVIADKERLQYLGFLSARIEAAASIMETEGGLTTAAEAYERAAIQEARPQAPGKPASSLQQPEAAAVGNQVRAGDSKHDSKHQIEWHASPVAKPTDKPSQRAAVRQVPRESARQPQAVRAVDPQVQAAALQNLANATRHCQVILAGAEPRSVSRFVTAAEKPVLLKMLVDRMSELPSHAEASPADRIKILHIAKFLQAWQAQEDAATPLAAQDLTYFTHAQQQSLARAQDLDARKL